MPLQILPPNDPESPFPTPDLAEKEPNGLLAVGGDLSPTRILNAYRQGIFPWFSEGDPILWWSPDPRMVLLPDELRISRSLRKKLRRDHYQVSMDQAFDQVIQGCAAPRPNEPGTWLVSEMIEAYRLLHKLGWAHSVEVWRDNQLIGGLYGIAIGQVFYGESMFSREADASKIALVLLARTAMDTGIKLIDCQVYTEHLASLGAREIDREDFQQQIKQYAEENFHKIPFVKDKRSTFSLVPENEQS